MMNATNAKTTHRTLTLLQLRPSLGASPDRQWLERLLRSLADSVDLLHRSGSAHLALSPHSVVFGSDGQPALLDQSALLAAHAATVPAGTDGATRPGLFSVHFMAPEQRLHAGGNSAALGAPGPWSDLYALAAVAYFALTGAAPRLGSTRPALAQSAATPAASGQARPADAGQATDGRDTSFDALWRGIESGLAFEPQHRPRDVAALMRAFGLPERRQRARGRSESLLMCGAAFDGLGSLPWAGASATAEATLFADTQFLDDGLGDPAGAPAAASPQAAWQAPEPLRPSVAVTAQRARPATSAAPSTRSMAARRARARRTAAAVRPRTAGRLTRIARWLLAGVSATAVLAAMATAWIGPQGPTPHAPMAQQAPRAQAAVTTPGLALAAATAQSM